MKHSQTVPNSYDRTHVSGPKCTCSARSLQALQMPYVSAIHALSTKPLSGLHQVEVPLFWPLSIWHAAAMSTSQSRHLYIDVQISAHLYIYLQFASSRPEVSITSIHSLLINNHSQFMLHICSVCTMTSKCTILVRIAYNLDLLSIASNNIY